MLGLGQIKAESSRKSLFLVFNNTFTSPQYQNERFMGKWNENLGGLISKFHCFFFIAGIMIESFLLC